MNDMKNTKKASVKMPRGKPFVCWIRKDRQAEAEALRIGDIVDLKIEDGSVVRGKFGCHRHGILPYFVRVGRKLYEATLIFNLSPVEQEAS